MDFSEVIGFIITMVLLLFLFLKKMWEDVTKKPSTTPPAQQEELMGEMLEALGIKVEKKVEPEPVVIENPVVREEPKREGVNLRIRSEVAKVQRADPSSVQRLLRKQKSMRDAILLHEIIGPPKGL